MKLIAFTLTIAALSVLAAQCGHKTVAPAPVAAQARDYYVVCETMENQTISCTADVAATKTTFANNCSILTSNPAHPYICSEDDLFTKEEMRLRKAMVHIAH